MTDKCDVLVVGGAAVGSAVAYFLACAPGAAGAGVRVVERDPSYRDCATTRSLASLRHQFSTPENIRMSMFGTDFVRRADELLAVNGQAPGIALHEAGYLFLATRAGLPALRANLRTQLAEGADVALLDPPALRRRFPWLATADLAGGTLGLSGEGWLDAHALMQGLRRKAVALGARWEQGEVVDLERQGRRVVAARLADGSRIGCDWVVNAAGTGAARLARCAGIVLPVESRKRCVFRFRSPARLPSCPLVVDPSGLYFRPDGDGFLCGAAPPAAADPEAFDFDVPLQWFDDELWPALAHRVPGFEAARRVAAWAGHYDVNTLDHNVIVGPHPECENLLFANGFSGHGLQQAPAVGRALAEWVRHGGYRTIDLSALGWQRVIDGRPLIELNVV